MNNHPPPSGEVLKHAASVALYAEVRSIQFAQDDGYYVASPTGALMRLVEMDDRYAHWPEALARARRLAYGTSQYYGMQFWRMHTGMAPAHFSAALPESEQHLAQGLLEAITWSRAEAQYPGHASRFPVAGAESVKTEYYDLLRVIGGVSLSPYHVPDATWDGLVHKLVISEIQLGDGS